MLVTLLHLLWWLRHLLQTEIVTSFIFLPWDWILLGFEGLSFILSSYSRLTSSLSPSLMVVVASLNTPIVCLANVIELFRKMIVVFQVSRTLTGLGMLYQEGHLQPILSFLSVSHSGPWWPNRVLVYEIMLCRCLLGMDFFESLRYWSCACPSVLHASSSISCDFYVVVAISASSVAVSATGSSSNRILEC